MKEVTIQSRMKVYASAEELPAAERRALQYAHQALELAYAPYSNFQVGAAVLLESGALLMGANQENAAYPMCLCAERAALGNAAVNHPGEVIKALAITVNNLKKPIKSPAAPCGSCRQVIHETEIRQQQPISIVLQGSEGEVFVLDSSEALLPLGFHSGYL